MTDIEGTKKLSSQDGRGCTSGLNEKWRIVLNVTILSGAFMVQFTAYEGTANLQSSINAGLGQISLAAIYGSVILSSVFVPVVAIKYLGCKWTMALSLITYMPYIAAQFHPTAYTLIPAAVAVGLGGAPLWCAKCTYLTVVAEAYSNLTGIPVDVIVVRFFGIFFMFFQCAQIWGNLISSLVLSRGTSSGNSSTVGAVGGICGINFCPEHATKETLPAPSIEKINMIAFIYLGCMICSVLIVALFVDSTAKYDKDRRGSGTGLTGFRLLSVVLKLLSQRNQILILPITIWLGMTHVLLAADFTSAYVTCAWGVSKVGYVMICYGVFNAFSAITMGWLTKITGKLVVVGGATVIHLGLFAFLLNWIPRGRENELYILLLVTGLWGVADGGWYVQINDTLTMENPMNLKTLSIGSKMELQNLLLSLFSMTRAVVWITLT
ncbi:UNC93-like protein isoform X2 [Cephus cinctus]|uniref:UNC93-like protein isoform X2 n=1 Tax=Cephus cinctus TaxID=211228 RepID=A0AAJ7FRW6_CEPCN|nr:UNC93-like protein isoform X2 [Cephus cinctus]